MDEDQGLGLGLGRKRGLRDSGCGVLVFTGLGFMVGPSGGCPHLEQPQSSAPALGEVCIDVFGQGSCRWLKTRFGGGTESSSTGPCKGIARKPLPSCRLSRTASLYIMYGNRTQNRENHLDETGIAGPSWARRSSRSCERIRGSISSTAFSWTRRNQGPGSWVQSSAFKFGNRRLGLRFWVQVVRACGLGLGGWSGA